VLILREVLGYSAAETAGVLDASVASVNSALQRARSTLESRTPEREPEPLPGRVRDRKSSRRAMDFQPPTYPY
jgi:RNA polymerase sigma-70 factor, ECF subfamily